MTAIYKTGTVSVNNGSNIVTGNGTSFIDVANVQEGDLFTVDGQKFYEAYEVDTNTQIKIRNIVTGGAFAETNVTAGNFAIIRNFTSQTSAEIAGKVLAVQQKWMNREEEMTDWFYTANDWATVTSINGDQLNVMTPNGINNLLAPGAFGPDCSTAGIAGNSINVNSGAVTDDRPNGRYYASAINGRPDDINGNFYFSRSNPTTAHIIYHSNNGKIYTKKQISGAWDSDWTPQSPQAFGIGAEFGEAWPNGADLNDITGVKPGLYKIYAASPTPETGFPEGYSANANVTIIFNIEAATRMSMILIDAKSGSTHIRAYNNGWQPYRGNFDSSNLNPNSFGVAANDLIGKGSAASASVAVFELPIVSKTAPTSLSVTGTFKIKNPASGSDLITGISAATIANALNSSSSDRWAYIVLSGLTGLTFDHALHLVGETADANIKVNF